MKTIKIFLASSEELDYDRMAFGNLVRRLDDMYEKRGIRIKLFEWEDYDSAYNDKRKQDEYNEYVCQSDIFLALFHKKAGQFTIEEFDKASEQFKATASPKVYTYCKDLKPGEEESKELKEFKERLFIEMGHYWCRYDNRESLQFQFVMQLQLVESNRMDDVKVEDGVVTINGLPVAKMENLKFTAANEDYIKMQTEIQELRKEIEEMQLDLEKKQTRLETKKGKLEENPDDEDCQEDYKEKKEEVEKLTDRLQPKLNKYNKLKEDFAEHQKILLNTAKKVSQLQGEYINKSIKDAIDAFNEGKVKEANYILERSEDSKPSLEDYKISKEITEQKRQNQISYINKLTFWASTIMADASIPIDKRVKQADDKYKDAIDRARTIDYDEDKYFMLIIDYAEFASRFAHYETALKYDQEALAISKKMYGAKHPDTATLYNNIGLIYQSLGKYDKALEYYMQALDITEAVLGKKHPDTAASYLNIGNVYYDRMNYDKALDYFKQALNIQEKVLDKEHPNMASSYNNIGTVYNICGDYDNALDYYKKAIDISEKILGKEHPVTAKSFNNIGDVYSNLGKYDKAKEYYELAAEQGHDIAQYSLGSMYESGKGVEQDYTTAAEWYRKAAEQGNHYALRQLGNLYEVGIGVEMDKLKAAELYRKAGYTDPGLMYETERNYEKAIEWYFKAAEQGNARAQYRLGRMYKEGNGLEQNYVKAAELYHNAAEQGYKRAYNGLAWTLHLMGKYNEALPWAEKAVGAFPEAPYIIDTLASVYQNLGRYDEALEKFKLCLKLKHEQNDPEESIQKTEEKIAALKVLVKQQ